MFKRAFLITSLLAASAFIAPADARALVLAMIFATRFGLRFVADALPAHAS